MKISLVTACRDAERTIDRTLRSVQAQNYANLEFILVDGLSSDGTVRIARQFGQMISHLLSEKDHGVAEAINKGFRLATGDVHCYLNADDSLAPGALDRVAEEFRSCPDVDVVTGGCQRVFADGSTLITQVPDHFESLMALRNDLEQPSTFWRSSIHRKAGELDESYALAFDWEWWNRLRLCGARFKVLPDVLSIYHFTDENLTSRAGMRVVEEMCRVTRKYGPYRGRIADVYRLLFRLFDMNGYYDQPFDQLDRRRQRYFGAVLRLLYAVFGREIINAYNWNWASKQIRGVTWYK